jgi:Cu+-exporting ATPase
MVQCCCSCDTNNETPKLIAEQCIDCLSHRIENIKSFVARVQFVPMDASVPPSDADHALMENLNASLKQNGFLDSDVLLLNAVSNVDNCYDLYFFISSQSHTSMRNIILMLASQQSIVIQEIRAQSLCVLTDVKPMKCMNCVNGITTKLNSKLESVPHFVYCNLESKQVYIFTNEKIPAQTFINALKELGKEAYVFEETVLSKLITKFTLSISNMKCDGCVSKVEQALAQIEGIRDVYISLEEKQCSLVYEHGLDSEILAGQFLADSISKLGHPTKVIAYESFSSSSDQTHRQTVELDVNGMRCDGCVNKIKDTLQSKYKDQIGDVIVDLERKKVSVLSSAVTKEVISRDIINLGFQIANYSKEDVSIPIKVNTPEILEEIVIHETKETQGNSTAIVSIEGMSCSSCVSKIEDKIGSLKGVCSCYVNLITQKGEIVYDSSLISEEEIIEQIINLGFESSSLTNQVKHQEGRLMLHIESLNSPEVNSVLSNIQGIIDFSIDERKKIVDIQFKENLTCARHIIDKLKELSIECSIFKESTFNMKESILRKAEIKKWKRFFLISAIFTIPTMIIAMGISMIPLARPFMEYQIIRGLSIESIILFILVTPVQFYCGYPFFKLAFQTLKNRSADMNTLIAIATTEAYLYSVFAVIYNMVNPGEMIMSHYFETSASLIMFLTLGRWMENVAKGQTSSALVALMDLQPSSAILLEKIDSPMEQVSVEDCVHHPSLLTEREIEIDLVAVGDILKVIPGAKIPVDATVVYGSSSVDESMITGESLPVFKTVDSKVIGGTINKDGLLFIKATKIGANGTLSAIASLVEQSQTKKPKLQGLADRISGYFVPFVIAISLITFGVWMLLGYSNVYPDSWRPSGMSRFVFALLLSTSTVIIACPCSLGLATPTAVMCGAGVAAKNGILIKGGRALEAVSKCTAILFDKTGTLTKGELKVTKHTIFNEKYQNDRNSFSELCLWLHSIEGSSEHPIAKAVCAFAKENIIDQPHEIQAMSNFIAIPGRGISATIAGHRIDIGNEVFLNEQNITMPNLNENELNSRHSTLVFVAVDGLLCLELFLSDTIRPESRAVVCTLKSLKREPTKIYMLTGDNASSASYIAEKVGIEPDHVFSQLTPGGKSDKVKELQLMGEVVLMVGDGINDSPSLTQADASIAMGGVGGTDVAMECADIVLMTNSIEGVATAIDLSRTIYRRIIMNFVWAFLYNVLAIPVAAGVFFPLVHVMIPPWVAGLAMVLSSISVTISSLLLKFYRKPKLIMQNNEDNEDDNLRLYR